MTDDEYKMMRELEAKGDLYDLAKEAAESNSKKDDNKKPSSDDGKSNGPISDKAKEMLISRLTELPGKSTKLFLAEFGIEKIKELPQSAFDAAVNFLEKLETEAKGGKEKDPFED